MINLNPDPNPNPNPNILYILTVDAIHLFGSETVDSFPPNYWPAVSTVKNEQMQLIWVRPRLVATLGADYVGKFQPADRVEKKPRLHDVFQPGLKRKSEVNPGRNLLAAFVVLTICIFPRMSIIFSWEIFHLASVGSHEAQGCISAYLGQFAPINKTVLGIMLQGRTDLT